MGGANASINQHSNGEILFHAKINRMRKQYITYLPSLSLVVVTSNGSKKYSLSYCHKRRQHSLLSPSLSLSTAVSLLEVVEALSRPLSLSIMLSVEMEAKNNLSAAALSPLSVSIVINGSKK